MSTLLYFLFSFIQILWNKRFEVIQNQQMSAEMSEIMESVVEESQKLESLFPFKETAYYISIGCRERSIRADL